MTKDMHQIELDLGNDVVGAVNQHVLDMEQLEAKAREVGYAAEKVPAYLRDDPEITRRLIDAAKHEDEKAIREKARERAEDALERYPKEVAARRQALEEELFRSDEWEGLTNYPDLTVKAATASDEELHSLLSAASQTGNTALARAVFVEAHRRERTSPDGSDYAGLKRWVAEEFGGPFAEYLSVPTEEEVEKKVQVQRFMFSQEIPNPTVPEQAATERWNG